MMPVFLSPFANHLWQSTLFAVMVMLLTLALRNNRAQMRYWLWLAASIKFFIPFSVLVSVGSQLEWRSAPAIAPPVSLAMEQITQPFPPSPLSTIGTPAVPTAFPIVAIWLCGCAVVLFFWWVRWRRIQAAVRLALPLPIQAPIEVMSSPALLEPGVFGVFRPVLLLPEGIADRLTPAQLKAILAHELCHVRRRDNLAAAIHMMVEAIFWFHPLVWWIGARLVDERERACDEEVLRLGSEPEVYAEGILNVCKFYLESPLVCASGVTGSDLRKRIESIMTNRISYRLTLARKLMLAAAGMAAVTGPIVIGMMNAPRSRAQSSLKFEVASIRPADPDARNSSIHTVPGGGLNVNNVTLKQLVTFAYDVRGFQISGGPDWLGSEKFNILAKPPSSEGSDGVVGRTHEERRFHREQMGRRLQALLAERFQLTIHRETKELPVYALVLAKNGHKLEESKEEDGPNIRMGRGLLTGERSSMQELTKALSEQVSRIVVDQTGLKGKYNYKIEWTPDSVSPAGKGGLIERPDAPTLPDLSGPSLFTAIQEQLGLKLESRRAPVEIIVIDRAEKPSEN